MICLMFLTIMCLATQKNILCKLLKLYHQQQQQQGGEWKGQGEVGLRLRGRSFLGFIFGGQWRWRLLSPPLCHRLCLLSNVNGVALPCPPSPPFLLPSCPRLVVLLSTCEQLSGGYQFGPFVVAHATPVLAQK